jgi:hypothetical protein
MSKTKLIEAEAQARWDAVLGRDLKEQKPIPQPEQKEDHETTLGRTVPAQQD